MKNVTVSVEQLTPETYVHRDDKLVPVYQHWLRVKGIKLLDDLVYADEVCFMVLASRVTLDQVSDISEIAFKMLNRCIADIVKANPLNPRLVMVLRVINEGALRVFVVT